MQIHEITKLKVQQLEEGVFDTVGAGVGRTVSGAKNVASFVASPFKDVAQGYKTARMDQQTSALADKMYRAWQQYSTQWAKSQGGSYTVPGAGASSAAAGTTPPGAKPAPGAKVAVAKTTKTKASDLFPSIQAMDDNQLKAIAKILNQRVGPAATMAALKKLEPTPPTNESMINELGWQDVKNTASNIGTQIKQGVQMAPQFARQVGQGYKKATQAGIKAVKAAPGAIATGAGATAGAIAGMPARAQTAYRTGKQYVSGPTMTTTELQTAINSLNTAEAQKLLTFVQQIQQMRKAGLREGLSAGLDTTAYETALKAFVQKNMLSGMQYSRLQNAQQIDGLIKQIVDPANDTASAQKDLWNKLTLAAAVAQHAPSQASGQSAAGTGTSSGPSATPTSPSGEDADTLKDAIIPVLKQLGQDKNVATVGAAIRKTFTNNATDIKSTGVPAVDAMLITMGFNPA